MSAAKISNALNNKLNVNPDETVKFEKMIGLVGKLDHKKDGVQLPTEFKSHELT